MINNISYNPYVRTLDNSGNVINKNASLPTHSERSCANMSFRDLVETVEAAQAEQVKKCNLEIEQVGVAEFKPYEYTPEQQMTLDNMAKYFDFTNSKDYKEMTANEDFTGMTDTEKYKAIYEKYQHCYGENFLNAFALIHKVVPKDYNKYHRIIDRFDKEIEQACGSDTDFEKLRVEALYGSDLNNYQIREKILDEYYHEGMTIREIIDMAKEMSLCGVGAGLLSCADPCREVGGVFYGFNIFTEMKYDKFALREAILDDEVSAEHLGNMQRIYESRVAANCYYHPEYGAVLSQVTAKFLGGAL